MVRPSLSGIASPEQFAEAMLRCQNSSGQCSYEERCMYGGCFDSPKAFNYTVEKELRDRIEDLEAEISLLKGKQS